MKRVRLIIAYDGTNYVGWQTQNNGVSVQSTIEQALRQVAKEDIVLFGSGRTDSGVHAAAQVAHFDTDARMSSDKFAIALNSYLPPDIRVLYSETCPNTFHARYDAKLKQYQYLIHVGMHSDVFSRSYALQLHYEPEFTALQKSAAEILGEHDFRAFMSSGSRLERTVRTITQSEWKKDNCFLIYQVTGNGFLYNMVRILVGTMLDIAFERIPEDSVRTALKTHV